MQTKEEKAAYNKQYRKDNKEKVRQYNDENREIKATKEQVKRTKRNKMLFQHKGSACGHCLLSEPANLEIYDYHHIDPTTKLHNVATIVHGPLDRLMTEVDKCLLLCSNCHRKEHVRLRKEKINE